MFKLKAGDNEYLIKFGYKAITKSGMLVEVMKTQKNMSEIDKKKKEKEERKKNEENFPEYNVDEMGNPVEEEDDGVENLQILTMMADIVAPLILAGLQKDKQHPEYKVDYDNDEDVKEKTDLVMDLIDDYLDEDDSEDVAGLFTMLVNELFESGFLSNKSEKLTEAMEKQDATITPTDHLQPQN